MADDGLSVNGPETLGGSVLLVVVALGVVGYGAVDYAGQTDALEDAVAVEATVIEAGVETTSTPGTGDVEFRPTVRYRYSYDGSAYTGTDLFPGSVAPTYDTESAAREALAGYEPDAAVTAYVDPAAPEAAFLEDRPSNTPLVIAGIGAVLALLGGASALGNYRDR